MNTKSLTYLALIGAVSLTSAQTPGPCPKVAKFWDHDTKGRLNTERIQGTWYNVYDNHDNVGANECTAIKIAPSQSGNSTTLQFMQGSMFSPHEFDPIDGDAVPEEDKGPFFMYDDNLAMIFNHANNSAVGAIVEKNDAVLDPAKFIEENMVKDLTEEEMQDMSEEDIANYREEQTRTNEFLQTLATDFDTFDHYANGLHILDTDYDNYLMVYSCRQTLLDEEAYTQRLDNRDTLVNSIKNFADDIKANQNDDEKFKAIQKKIDENPEVNEQEAMGEFS